MKNPECHLGPPKTTPLSGTGFRAAVRIAALSGAVVLAAATTSCASPPATGPAQGTVAMAAPASQPSTAPTAAPAKTTAPVAPAPAPIVAEASRVAPAAPAPTPSTGYVVKPGDTVGAIAAEAGVDPAAMLAANGLGTYSVIVPGQMLKLTGPPVTAPAEPSPTPGAAPAPAKAPTAAEAPAPVAAPPAVRTIYVAGSGGQAAVDKCIGPIRFTPDDAYSLFIVEHDFCGGWAQFSGIQVGETVTIAGYGTYSVTGRGQVPNPGTTGNVVAALGGMPRAVLQTCIPGTNQMLVIALN